MSLATAPAGYDRGALEHGSVVHFVDFDTDSMLALGNDDPDAALCGRTGDFESITSTGGNVCSQCTDRVEEADDR